MHGVFISEKKKEWILSKCFIYANNNNNKCLPFESLDLCTTFGVFPWGIGFDAGIQHMIKIC